MNPLNLIPQIHSQAPAQHYSCPDRTGYISVNAELSYKLHILAYRLKHPVLHINAESHINTAPSAEIWNSPQSSQLVQRYGTSSVPVVQI